MKALFYNFSIKKFLVKEVSLPRVGENEFLIRVVASSLCATDRYIIEGSLKKKVYNKKEIILGHSFSGIIESPVKSFGNFFLGDRIFCSEYVWCGKCKNCQEGQESICDNRYIFGMEAVGAHAEFIVVPERVIFNLPNEISFEVGSLICDVLALSCHAIRLANVNKNEKIIIFGAGPVGLTLAFVLQSKGFLDVCLIEKNIFRYKSAKKIVNYPIFLSLNEKKEGGASIIFETTGQGIIFDRGCKFLDRGGKMIVVGVYQKNVNFNVLKLVSRQLSFLGVYTSDVCDIEEAVDLCRNGRVDLSKIITHQFLLKDGQKAYDLMESQRALRIILRL